MLDIKVNNKSYIILEDYKDVMLGIYHSKEVADNMTALLNDRESKKKKGYKHTYIVQEKAGVMNGIK